MSNIKIAGFQSNLFEELDDADLAAVVGGGGTDIVGDLASNVTGTVSESGNKGTPTSALIDLFGKTLSAAGEYVSNNAGVFAETALQGVNKTAVDAGNSL